MVGIKPACTASETGKNLEFFQIDCKATMLSSNEKSDVQSGLLTRELK